MVAVVFLIAIIVVQVFDARTPQELAKYNAALLSICFMILLGFADDVVDLPWRFKLVLPPIASLPLLCSYTGGTSIVMPLFSRALLWNDGPTFIANLLNFFVVVDAKSFGSIVNLGSYYYLYMSLLAVFCTNAINIYAGVNGLEVGQSVIIGIAILATNLYELSTSPAAATDHPHMLSAIVMLVFVAVSIALTKHNWYPADVFVGDTYCYFAGMTFAVVGILGHFSKTLLLFLLPQIFNFVYSVPQLFKIFPCPRHRLPAFDVRDGLRRPSQFVHNGKTYDNMTLINLVLRICGPMTEETLTTVLIALQVACCVLGFFIRYHYGPTYLYNGV